MSHSACTIVRIMPHHNPDEGRNIINDNFDCINAVIEDIQVTSVTGATVVSAATNINVSLSYSGTVPFYTVSTVDDPIFNSLSAISISADTIYSGTTNLNDILTGISSSVVYTNSAATTTTIGGIAAGSTFSAQTMQEMWDALLYPYQAPAFTSFSRGNLSTTYELGETVAIGSQTFTWAISNASNLSANTVSIVQNFAPTTTIYGPGANAGSSAITLSNTYSAGTSTSTTLYTISAVNSQGSSLTSTISRSWRPRWYYGKFSGTTVSASDIVTLANSALAASVTNTYYTISSGASAEYVYFCIPSTFSQPSDFRDSTGGCFGTNWPYSVQGSVVVTNAYGVNITYTVYRFTNPTAGAVTAWLCP